MSIRSLIVTISSIFFLCSTSVMADETKTCNDQQKTNCGRFCSMHKGMQSCVIDIDKKTGTCTCSDGATHSKTK